ncbi:dual specificity tyrosine-phosphorylation-regulated kinase 1A-like isoform X2 [Musca domestica]|nr:dual specificity tyrosine-phosphorylation-regulated kinase 1A-like isoform X2 [Musca domestica]XP_058982319.1 dual specificity tyrosine-phosphorylation-regulated kinase 1A-like isoform X2 [Musca domestica]
MNDYWHIPRASLSPSSASSAVSSASSTQRSHRSVNTSKLTPTHYRQPQQQQQTMPQYYDDHPVQRHHQKSNQAGGGGSRRNSEMSSYHHHHHHHSPSHAHAVSAAGTHIIGNKRGSRSSQGSSDSNNSTRSAASGSLLLTAANLERMTEIQRKQEKQQHSRHNNNNSNTHTNAAAAAPSSVYSANLLHATSRAGDHQYHQYQLATVSGEYVADVDQPDNVAAGKGMADGKHTAIDIDPNLNFIKTKDLDTVSIASSMHFTMVNGEAGANKKTKKGLCDRGRQVTVLIISMSTIFLLLIMGMVYALEMRAREMPQS